jgi:hypothetical protein
VSYLSEPAEAATRHHDPAIGQPLKPACVGDDIFAGRRTSRHDCGHAPAGFAVRFGFRLVIRGPLRRASRINPGTVSSVPVRMDAGIP